MPLEKCPSCGKYTLDIDQVQKILKCYSNGCNYSEPVDVEKYLEVFNELPLLAAPIETEEINNAIEKLSVSGTFRTVKELDPQLKDEVRKALEARRKKVEKKLYALDRTLRLFQQP